MMKASAKYSLRILLEKIQKSLCVVTCQQLPDLARNGGKQLIRFVRFKLNFQCFHYKICMNLQNLNSD